MVTKPGRQGRIFIVEDVPPSAPEGTPKEGASPPPEAQPGEADRISLQAALEWGKNMDKGVDVLKKVIMAVKSGEARKLLLESGDLIGLVKAAAKGEKPSPPPSGGATPPSAPAAPPQLTAPVEMEQYLDVDELIRQAKDALHLMATVYGDRPIKELEALAEKNEGVVRPALDKAVKAAIKFRARGKPGEAAS